MNKLIIIPLIIIPLIIIPLIISLVVVSSDQEIDKDETIGQWQESGPFEIDKDEYNLGEKIFLSVQNINANDKGEVKFMRPLNITHSVQYIGIPFDGMKKDGFNYYFQPRYNVNEMICSTEDLVGTWTVIFSGTEYKNLHFEILNQTSSWDERSFESVC